MKKINLFLLLLAFSLNINAQDNVILKTTFIKVKPGNNYSEDLRTKFSKMAQKRIDAGYQNGWHLWQVVGNPQSPFSHMIVEPMLISQMEKERSMEGWLKMRSEVFPEMTDSDWTLFMEGVRDKRDIVAEAIFTPVIDIQRDKNVSLPDEIGVINWMKVKEGKFKTYENLEKAIYADGLDKNGLVTGWSLNKRVDKVGTNVYWNYFTVDWYSSYSDVIKRRASSPSWDANKSYQNMLDIRDLLESVIVRKVMMLE